MFKKIRFLTLILFLSASISSVQAQYNIDQLEWQDSSTNILFTNVNFGFYFPYTTGYFGDLFLHHFNAGTNVFYKTKSNWTFDVAFNYLFDGNLRSSVQPTDLFGDVVYDNGNIIDNTGNKSTLSIKGNGWYYGVGIGKIIPLSKRWKNSGLWVRAGFGYQAHKIHIGPTDQTVPIFQDDYKKGYDQRSSGFAMSQFVGYFFMRKKRSASFYAGVEFWEMWTRPNRSYSFMLGSYASTPMRFSGSIGIKVGWVISLYEKKAVTTLYKF